MTIIYDKKERAFFGACVYLGALFISCIILWWTLLVGGNPLTFRNTELIDQHGTVTSVLHVGESAGVRRHVCSSQSVGVEFFPALKDSAGLIYPLPSGMVEAEEGCKIKTYGFKVPDIPPGEYTYASAIRYQANLVGRDELAVTPVIRVRIVR